MASRTLYLIRHGQHERLPGYRHQDFLTMEQANQLDGGLTRVGKQQAKLTAQRFRGTPINTIHCSNLPRAVQTAEVIAGEFPYLEPKHTRRLRECIPCPPREPEERFSDVPWEDCVQGARAAEEAFRKYFRRARGRSKNDILVCHGNLIRYFVCRVLQVEPEAWVNMLSFNCGVTQVVIEADGWMRLVGYNDVGHLPRSLWTHT